MCGPTQYALLGRTKRGDWIFYKWPVLLPFRDWLNLIERQAGAEIMTMAEEKSYRATERVIDEGAPEEMSDE